MTVYEPQQVNPRQSPCGGRYRLIWRNRTLLVRPVSDTDGFGINVLDGARAAACLRRSPARRVKLSPMLSSDELMFWAGIAARAGRPAYLSLPGDANLPQKVKPFHWRFKCVMDKLVAFSLMLILAPIELVMVGLITIFLQDSVLIRDWQVGARGRLYQALYFRTVSRSGRALPFANWIRRLRIDRLPKLINVLRGEMSLVGACPRRLHEASQIAPCFRNRLNALPGVTGAWHLQSHLALLDSQLLHRIDLQYVWSWSLRRDFACLVRVAPRLFIV